MRPATLQHIAIRMTGVAVLTLGLSACQLPQSALDGHLVNPDQPPPEMAPAALPTYQSGDKYYYSNGRSEQVVGVQGEQVTWLINRKRKMVGYRSFFIPPAYYELSENEVFKESRISTHALWPLTPDQQERFTTDAVSQSLVSERSNAYQQKWVCKTGEAEQIRVLAGTFDTYRVVCDRFSASGKWWQTITWFYAPEINAPVLRISFYKKSGEYKTELTAVRPSLNDLSDESAKGIRQAFQNALENLESGITEYWSDGESGLSVAVTPVQTFRAQGGQFCRNYRQVLTINGQPRTYAGVACRKDKLQWVTPARM